MNLEFRDLKPNAIYYYTYSDGYILKTGSSTIVSYYIQPKSGYYSNNGNFSGINLFREATFKEKAHLEVCIKMSKYVEAPKRNIIYKLILE